MQLRHTVARAGAVALLFVGMLTLPPTGAAERAPRSRESRALSLSGHYDSVVFYVRSPRCFNSTRRRFTFLRTPTPRLHVAEMRSSRTGTTGSAQLALIPLATVELTPEQVSRLENLLHYYRRSNRSRDLYTFSDHLTIGVYRSGRKVRSEYVHDRQGASQYLGDAHPDDIAVLAHYERIENDELPVLSLERAADVAADAKAAGRSLVPYRDLPRAETPAFRYAQEVRPNAQTRARADRLARALPGYEAIRRDFPIRSANVSRYELAGYRGESVRIELSARSPRPVDTIRWYNPMNAADTAPRFDWDVVNRLHQKAERAVTPHGWIREWRALAPGRRVEFHAVGRRPWTERAMTTFVCTPWRHAGLKGHPLYEVVLRRADGTWAKLYFGDDDPRALIVSNLPPKGSMTGNAGHWLDGLPEFAYRPGSTQQTPQYAVVTPQGAWRLNGESR